PGQGGFDWVSAVYGQSIPLPLTWTSFKAALNPSNQTDLNWTTSAEKNTLAFEVEKSMDGKSWTMLHRQAAAGNTTEENSYHAVDNDVAFGTTLYRIKQIDIDNQFTYSSVQKVVKVNTSEISIYPNPAMTTLHIALNSEVKNTLIEIYSLEGKKLMSETTNNMNHSLNVETLTKGTYMIRISNKEKTYTSKFVRQ
ncbi:MAG TPA: T9SS type A sorting domain-containing protein, partial [Chitinophagaceae bacterium]|nr:T9SS type A sorting domain-containing protein [Chitinophagaceae bacterium]